MNRSTIIRRGVATGIAGAGLAVGGLGIAAAAEDGAESDSSTPAASSSTDTSSSERGNRDHGPSRGPGGGRGLGGPELAEALGVSESQLQSALDSIREQRESSQTEESAPPAEGDLEERRDQMVDALAEELDLSVAEVTAAFDEVQQAHADERRTALGDRLDEAVDAGDLTAQDRASVLKAFDAGVLGGPERGRGTR